MTNPSSFPSRSRTGYGAVRALTSAAPALTAVLGQLPARAVLGLLWVYQRTLSPVLPVVFGPACGCRFAPTCSHYAAEAIRVHGALIGLFFALRRLVKCTPLHAGGFDPVPQARQPQCHAVDRSNIFPLTCALDTQRGASIRPAARAG